jgi:hypothetical protein
MAIVKIKTAETILAKDNPKTYLIEDTASGVSALNVKNVSGFNNQDIIIVGLFGNQGSEILNISGTPSSGVITLSSSPLVSHSSGTPIQVLLYDQAEISNSSTIDGTPNVLDVIPLVPNEETTNYNDESGSIGYYFIRFYNSLTTGYSSYSDPIAIDGYSIFSARDIIDNALSDINKTTSEVLSDEYGFQQINNCQMETLREFKRWSFMQVMDYSLGSLSTGQYKVALPTDCDDQNTNKTIWNFRIGTGDNLTWVDKEKWNNILQNVAHTTLDSNINIGDLVVTLYNSSDFNDSGTIEVGENKYDYTDNDRSTGILTLSEASTTENLVAQEDVFQSATFGTPRYWTVFGGYAYFYPVLGTTLDGRIAKMDYYKKVVRITNDTDEIVLPDPTTVQYYLEWKYLRKLNNGEETQGSKQQRNNYDLRVKKLKQKEVLGRSFKLKSQLNQINIGDNVDDKQIRTGNFSQD